MRYYIVTFDRVPGRSYRAFHADLVSASRISQWWHYIKNSYIVGTSWTAEQLADHFAGTARRHGLPAAHLVVEVYLGNRQGRLSKDAWSWLRRNARKQTS